MIGSPLPLVLAPIGSPQLRLLRKNKAASMLITGEPRWKWHRGVGKSSRNPYCTMLITSPPFSTTPHALILNALSR